MAKDLMIVHVKQCLSFALSFLLLLSPLLNSDEKLLHLI